MNVAQSISYMFKDGSWFYKVFVGGLFVALSAVALGIPFVVGYQVRHVRDMIGNEEDILPEWKNSTGMFKDGVAVLCALAIYLAVLAGAAFAAGVTISLTRLALAAGIVLLMWMPLVLIQYAKRPRLFGCFDLVALTSPITRTPMAFVTTIGVLFVVTAAVIGLGWMSLIIGWPFVIFWGITVQTHVIGQLARLQ